MSFTARSLSQDESSPIFRTLTPHPLKSGDVIKRDSIISIPDNPFTFDMAAPEFKAVQDSTILVSGHDSSSDSDDFEPELMKIRNKKISIGTIQQSSSEYEIMFINENQQDEDMKEQEFQCKKSNDYNINKEGIENIKIDMSGPTIKSVNKEETALSKHLQVSKNLKRFKSTPSDIGDGSDFPNDKHQFARRISVDYHESMITNSEVKSKAVGFYPKQTIDKTNVPFLTDMAIKGDEDCSALPMEDIKVCIAHDDDAITSTAKERRSVKEIISERSLPEMSDAELEEILSVPKTDEVDSKVGDDIVPHTVSSDVKSRQEVSLKNAMKPYDKAMALSSFKMTDVSEADISGNATKSRFVSMHSMGHSIDYSTNETDGIKTKRNTVRKLSRSKNLSISAPKSGLHKDADVLMLDQEQAAQMKRRLSVMKQGTAIYGEQNEERKYPVGKDHEEISSKTKGKEGVKAKLNRSSSSSSSSDDD